LGINSTLRKDLFISDHEHSPRGFYFIHLCQGIRIGNKEIQTWRFYKYEYTVKIDVKNGKEEPTYFYPERSEIYHCGEIPPIPEMHNQIRYDTIG
jgi:hypothetical protein